MILPKKIFNRCKSIPFAKKIYQSSNSGEYKFCGVRDKRKGNESLTYSIPNNKNPKCPEIKGFQRMEIDMLWQFLLKNREIRTSNVKLLCPELYKEGGCCFAAFYGIINTLHPRIFTKSTGLIKFK
jgi:hypothetical protein